MIPTLSSHPKSTRLLLPRQWQKKAPRAKAAAPTGNTPYETALYRWASHQDLDSHRCRIIAKDIIIHPDESISVKAGGVTVNRVSHTTVPVKFRKVAGGFSWTKTLITSCHNMPDEMVGDGMYIITENQITDFRGGPPQVNGLVVVSDNPASSLEGLPRVIRGNLVCDNMPNLKNLKGISDYIDEIDGEFEASQGTQIESHILGLMLIQGLTKVTIGNPEVESIINKHLASAERDEIECQSDLIQAGFNKFAKL